MGEFWNASIQGFISGSHGVGEMLGLENPLPKYFLRECVCVLLLLDLCLHGISSSEVFLCLGASRTTACSGQSNFYVAAGFQEANVTEPG